MVGQESNQDSVLWFYRQMLEFRQKSNSLRKGKTIFFDTEEPVLAFSRRFKGESVICVFNLSKEEVSIKIDNLEGPSNYPKFKTELSSQGLRLGANGFCFLSEDSDNDVVMNYP